MNTQLKERPIILNTQEVNAVLAGNKTQHRVPIKLRYGSPEFLGGRYCNKSDPSLWGWDNFEDAETRKLSDEPCPFGAIGDRLWVRETHHAPDFLHDYEQQELAEGLITRDDLGMSYKADAPHMTPADGGWTSPVAMPRWASRLLLEITDVCIERIQDISDIDARAMGLKPDYCDHKYQTCEDIGCIGKWAEPLMNYFIHEKNIKNVSSHDWIWVVEFKKVDD
ncbi:hypothetical protein [Psychrobacter sp. PSP]|uniref:hypothetical protein n=1 Tax=Psychrobacter sp. PSP TaxID=2734636 RepID=UPI002094B1D2|nr:hypothetical protein [Psychrobacter sp. PSP]